MSLQIWLPLTENALNYGVHPSNITVSNATLNSNGKLGGCYSFNGSSSHIYGTQTVISNDTNNWTFTCWMKLNVVNKTQTLFSCRNSVNSYGITIFFNGSYWLIDDGVRWQPTNSVVSANTWYHICIVRKKGIGKYLYIDGTLVSSTTTVGTQSNVNTTNFVIGLCHQSVSSYSDNPLNGYLNDVRFYDHALSEVEIKELAKGLVCHYKLDDVQSSDNLIINGFGEFGSENWNDSSRISTTEIPPDHPEIKASFYNGNMTKEYIPICQDHRYTITGYVKAMANQSGTTYPSLWPYDIDKKFIQYQNSQAGFNTATATTLRQPLHKGDTVIYATDLSQWTTADNYYYYVAIFGYKNSLGETYPDLFYTNESPKFGSKTDKSNLDKTNNTITLSSAFNGADRPAGTVICQATEGSTYFYPWNGISISSISDWVAKTSTFKPSSNTRLRAAAYLRWNTYGKCYIAGSKLVDNFFNDDRIIDSSGYNNHGTKNGNVTMSTSTPRYSYSTVFDGSSAYIDINSAIFPAVLNESFTLSIWIYNSDSGDRSILFGNYGLTGGFFNIEKTTAEKVRFYWNGNPDITLANTSLTANEFSHLVITRSGNTVKSYINGVLKDTSTTTLSGTIPATATNFRIGTDSRTSSVRFKGKISDFRLYATALTADDVKRLYEVSASVSKNGAMLGYEMKEG